jgi:coenzyme F420 hydrogenase subunit beta
VIKINIKGRYQVWTADGGYHEIPLELFHPHTCEGCKLCPDFAAQHADISTGGIGADDNWTLTLIRTARGEGWIKGVIDAGLIEARPGQDDQVAMNLLTKLATVSRKRWPGDAPRHGPVYQVCCPPTRRDGLGSPTRGSVTLAMPRVTGILFQ